MMHGLTNFKPITDVNKYHYFESKPHNITVTYVSDTPSSVSYSVQ